MVITRTQDILKRLLPEMEYRREKRYSPVGLFHMTFRDGSKSAKYLAGRTPQGTLIGSGNLTGEDFLDITNGRYLGWGIEGIEDFRMFDI